jgi:metal-dependent amidase/aminoacylase/carboxypeptidase family protein
VLYDLVDKAAQQSTEEVTFRIRSLKAEQRAAGDPSQAAIEVHLGRGDPSEASIEINLAVYDNTLRTKLLNAIADTAKTMVETAGGTLACNVDYAVPAVINDARVTEAVERAGQEVVGPANIIKGWRNRFADDVALVRRVPRPDV